MSSYSEEHTLFTKPTSNTDNDNKQLSNDQKDEVVQLIEERNKQRQLQASLTQSSSPFALEEQQVINMDESQLADFAVNAGIRSRLLQKAEGQTDLTKNEEIIRLSRMTQDQLIQELKGSQAYQEILNEINKNPFGASEDIFRDAAKEAGLANVLKEPLRDYGEATPKNIFEGDQLTLSQKRQLALEISKEMGMITLETTDEIRRNSVQYIGSAATEQQEQSYESFLDIRSEERVRKIEERLEGWDKIKEPALANLEEKQGVTSRPFSEKEALISLIQSTSEEIKNNEELEKQGTEQLREIASKELSAPGEVEISDERLQARITQEQERLQLKQVAQRDLLREKAEQRTGEELPEDTIQKINQLEGEELTQALNKEIRTGNTKELSDTEKQELKNESEENLRREATQYIKQERELPEEKQEERKQELKKMNKEDLIELRQDQITQLSEPEIEQKRKQQVQEQMREIEQSGVTELQKQEKFKQSLEVFLADTEKNIPDESGSLGMLAGNLRKNASIRQEASINREDWAEMHGNLTRLGESPDMEIGHPDMFGGLSDMVKSSGRHMGPAWMDPRSEDREGIETIEELQARRRELGTDTSRSSVEETYEKSQDLEYRVKKIERVLQPVLERL